MSIDEAALYWSSSGLQQGIEALLSATGRAVESGGLPPVPHDPTGIRLWLFDAPRFLGLEGSVQDIPKTGLLAFLLRSGTYAISLGRITREARYILVISEGFSCRVVQPDGGETSMKTVELADFVTRAMDETYPSLTTIFAKLPDGERALARMLKRERLDATPLLVVTFSPDAASPIIKIAMHGGALQHAIAFGLGTTLALGVTALAALTLGRAAVDGIIDEGRVLAWIMISLVGAPFTYMAARRLSLLSLAVGRAIKRRSLEGAFFLSEEILRRDGFSAQLARVNEASMLERASIADLFSLLTLGAFAATAMYLFATLTLDSTVLVLLAIGALVIAGALTARIIGTNEQAYRRRSVLSGEIVDKLIGHRTRAVQENPHRWHEAEDRRLAEYAVILRRLDRAASALALLPRFWIVAAGSLVAVEYVIHPSPDMGRAALAIFLLSLALSGIASAADQASALVTAWRSVQELFAAGRQRRRPQRTIHALEEQEEWPMVLAASSVAFSYRPGAKSIFSDASIRIRRGERVLIEGPSGGGKTTFAKILGGELRASGGSLLVCGIDPFTASEAQWRRLVASVPQFHENHVFAQTFAFNVDPTWGRDYLTDEAKSVCEELELGPVLAKMPAGSAQLMGETGWQLSHGERSRLFIARALLQKAQLIILDESFAALDPITMKTVVECVRRRASTLIVIAHV